MRTPARFSPSDLSGGSGNLDILIQVKKPYERGAMIAVCCRRHDHHR
jgi:hypothetical protein